MQEYGDFPGGPVVKALYSHYKEAQVPSLGGEIRSACCGAKKKKKKSPSFSEPQFPHLKNKTSATRGNHNEQMDIKARHGTVSDSIKTVPITNLFPASSGGAKDGLGDFRHSWVYNLNQSLFLQLLIKTNGHFVLWKVLIKISLGNVAILFGNLKHCP